MNRIKELRKKFNWTQENLGKRLGVQKAAISKYENGTISISDDIAIKLSSILNVSLDYLLGITDEKTEINLSHNDYLLGLQTQPPKNNNGHELTFKFDVEISSRLKHKAKQMDESYDFLAEILGITENEVFNLFEYGFVSHISIFVKIVEHFHVSSDYLLNRTDSTLTIQTNEDRLLKAFRSLGEDSKIIALSKLLEMEREESLVVTTEKPLEIASEVSRSGTVEEAEASYIKSRLEVAQKKESSA